MLLLLPPGYVTMVISCVFYLCASFTDDSFVFLPHLSLIEVCLQLTWGVIFLQATVSLTSQEFSFPGLWSIDWIFPVGGGVYTVFHDGCSKELRESHKVEKELKSFGKPKATSPGAGHTVGTL